MTDDDVTAKPARPARPSEPANRSDGSVASGIESGIVLLIFAGIGWALDAWLGTRPIFTLGLFVLGAIGLFYRYKAAYAIRMDELAAQRRARTSPDRRPTGEPG